MKTTALSLVFFLIVITSTLFGLDKEKPTINPPEGYFFVGCRPSFGECRMSCPTRQFWAIVSPSLCDEFTSPDDKIACFCAPLETLSSTSYSR